jgi:hypothetical protein
MGRYHHEWGVWLDDVQRGQLLMPHNQLLKCWGKDTIDLMLVFTVAWPKIWNRGCKEAMKAQNAGWSTNLNGCSCTMLILIKSFLDKKTNWWVHRLWQQWVTAACSCIAEGGTRGGLYCLNFCLQYLHTASILVPVMSGKMVSFLTTELILIYIIHSPWTVLLKCNHISLVVFLFFSYSFLSAGQICTPICGVLLRSSRSWPGSIDGIRCLSLPFVVIFFLWNEGRKR